VKNRCEEKWLKKNKWRTSYKLKIKRWDDYKDNEDEISFIKNIFPKFKVCHVIYSPTAKRRYGSMSQKAKLHACKQGLQLPPPRSQTEQEPAFSHLSQTLELTMIPRSIWGDFGGGYVNLEDENKAFHLLCGLPKSYENLKDALLYG
jgi:ABC-type uncharacterized transport system substrate-binding protein